jgi:hypothetical protein
MAGDIKLQYGTPVAFTQTNLDGIASSTTWVVGWTSASVDNSTDEYVDFLVSATFQVESTTLSAGKIVVMAYAAFNSTPTWPDLFSAGTEGTEGTATIQDTEIRDASFVPLWSCITDTTPSRNYVMPPKSIAQAFGGVVPPFWAIFVAQSTGTTLETTGDPNQVYRIPVNYQYT